MSVGIGGVAEILLYHGVIENTAEEILFKYMGRITGQHKNLKAGEYEFPAHVSMQDALRLLEEGKTLQRRFTVPEGLTSYEIVGIVAGVEELTGEIADTPPEGSLLPETYSYQKDETRASILKRMQDSMQDTLEKLWQGLPFATKEEALVLASIVEKETSVPEERARIAGVFINRLKKGIPLQTDPTVIYALTEGKPENEGQGPLGRRLLTKDLEFDSPYNTYKYPGLPPGPIANPGAESIAAVLNPEAHDFLYFVADGSGGHAFAATLEEHNANVAKWRKIRRTQK